MPELMNKESKPTFNFAGLQDRSMPKASEITPAVEEPVKRVRKTSEPTAMGSKKLVLNKPKY